jgi:2-oxoglutarate ferredoxin oxidoreductase subunit alpha
VIVDVQRAGPSTGQATKPAQGDVMQARWGSHGDYEIIALAPWSVQEMYEETIRAFNLAERFRVPVIILADEAVGHLRENIKIPQYIEIFDREKKPASPPFGSLLTPPMPSFGEGEKLLITGSTHNEWGFRKTACPKTHERLIKRLSQKILANLKEITSVETYFTEDAEILLIAYGFTARSSLAALTLAREEGIKVGLLRLKTIWPFPGDIVQRIEDSWVIVPEMNLGQLVREVERYLPRSQVLSFPKATGEVIKPEEILEFIRRVR